MTLKMVWHFDLEHTMMFFALYHHSYEDSGFHNQSVFIDILKTTYIVCAQTLYQTNKIYSIVIQSYVTFLQ